MNEIYCHFPFNSIHIQMLEKLEFLDPVTLKGKTDISLVSAAFGFDVNDVYLQFRERKLAFKNNMEIDIWKFWKKVRRTKNQQFNLSNGNCR